jgi:shikimate dehydrogenase
VLTSDGPDQRPDRHAAAGGSAAGNRCAVLGHPVGHSLSPVLHRVAYAQLGLDWTYTAHDVTAERLAGFVEQLDDSWRGLSLTMPLKRAVLPLLDDMDPTVLSVGAANTVLLAPGHRYGANTDVGGLVTALREAGLWQGAAHAVVVGGGATAASALASLSVLAVGSVELRVRDVARAGETLRTGRRLGLDVRALTFDEPWPGRPEVGVVVSTVPSAVAASLLPDAVLSAAAVVADARYDPWPSLLLRRAESIGTATTTGVDLLVHQAVGQIRLMTGRPVDPGPLRTAALQMVGRRADPDHHPG